MNSLITEYNELLSNYNTLIDLIKYCFHSNNDEYSFLNINRKEELKKQIPEKYFNKSKEQIKSEFKNVINELLKNNDNNVVFRSFYFTFLLDIYIMTQNDKNKKDLNKLTKEEQFQFIDRTIDYLLSFYKYNNVIIQYDKENDDNIKDNFSLLSLEINDDTVNTINSDNDIYNNIISFVICCKNFYDIKKQFIRNYTNYYRDLDFNSLSDIFNPHGGADARLDLEDDYKYMLISIYTKLMKFKENIDDLVIAYIAGDELFIRKNEFSVSLYFEDSYVNALYVFYIFEIPQFDQYFVNTEFYNENKYKESIKGFQEHLHKNTIDNIYNYYMNN